MATIRPLHDRILLKRSEKEEKSAGGIIIPGTAQEKTQWATVVAVGPGRLNAEGKHLAPSVSVGDVVLFSKYTGSEFKLDEEELVMVREEEILGVIQK